MARRPSLLFGCFILMVWTWTTGVVMVMGLTCQQGHNDWPNIAAWKASGGSWDIKKAWPEDGSQTQCTAPSCLSAVLHWAKEHKQGDKIFMYRGCQGKAWMDYRDKLKNGQVLTTTTTGASDPKVGSCFYGRSTGSSTLLCTLKSDLPKEGKKVNKECLADFENMVTSTPGDVGLIPCGTGVEPEPSTPLTSSSSSAKTTGSNGGGGGGGPSTTTKTPRSGAGSLGSTIIMITTTGFLILSLLDLI